MKQIIFIFSFFITVNMYSQTSEYEKLINQGVALLQNNQIKLAMVEFVNAVNLDSNKPDGYYGLGVCGAKLCYQNGRYCTEAIEQLKMALEISPNFRKANFNLGTCYLAIGQYENALKTFNLALEKDKNNGEIYLNRGHSYLYLNQKEAACSDFKKALELGINTSDIINSNCK